MTIELWITLAAANFAAYLAPGQNVALVGAATARAGLRGGVASVSGILVAEFIWTAVALALVLAAREVEAGAMHFLQIGGGIFLVWSGYGVLRGPRTEADRADTTPSSVARYAAFGVWVGLANPLALFFFVSIFPGLITIGGPQTALGLLAFCGSAVVVSSLLALLPYLAASQVLVRVGQSNLLNLMSGGALLSIGVVALAWTFA